MSKKVSDPCLTPAEVAAREAAAWRAGRDAAVRVVRASGYVDKSIMNVALSMLQPPAGLTAAAATCDAVAVEREAIAAYCDCECSSRAEVLRNLRSGDYNSARLRCAQDVDCAALRAAAIRARGRAEA